MKRTPLNRYTPMKRTEIRPVSEKTKAKRDALAPYRVWLKASAGCCMKCRRKLGSGDLDVHEIPAGSHRDRALRNPWTWLVLCRGCHDVLQGLDPQLQVAVLFAHVVESVNECYGRNVCELPTATRRDAR
jgi:hypothetical protein